MSKHPKFTEEVRTKIVAAVRSGAFLWVAAGIAGIHRSTLHKWLTSKEEEFQAFKDAVEEATAVARFFAERNVYNDDPKYWLSRGPGRERRDADGTLIEGWSNAPALTTPGQVNVSLNERWYVLNATLLDALADYPEARCRLAEVFAKLDWNDGSQTPESGSALAESGMGG